MEGGPGEGGNPVASGRHVVRGLHAQFGDQFDRRRPLQQMLGSPEDGVVQRGVDQVPARSLRNSPCSARPGGARRGCGEQPGRVGTMARAAATFGQFGKGGQVTHDPTLEFHGQPGHGQPPPGAQAEAWPERMSVSSRGTAAARPGRHDRRGPGVVRLAAG